jgi:hypothetical protein
MMMSQVDGRRVGQDGGSNHAFWVVCVSWELPGVAGGGCSGQLKAEEVDFGGRCPNSNAKLGQPVQHKTPPLPT